MRSNDVTSRRIVRAFIDFLSSVEPAPGVDLEGLEVAKDCLTQVFGLDHPAHITDNPENNLLVNLFSSPHQPNSKSETNTATVEDNSAGPSAPSYAHVASGCSSEAQNGKSAKLNDDAGVSIDELFGQFFDALEKIYFFRTTNGDDDHVLLDKATSLFHDAVNELEKSGCSLFDRKSLADALKTLGNKSMQSKLYSDAAERYTCAIALCGNDAVYYCNRAAAYTQLHNYTEAVKDCLKSIEINPSYSKAYSRLGLAYYAQGNYSDAINNGFRKALELDPNNDAVKENIRAAEQKLREQQQRNRFQGSRFHPVGGSGSAASGTAFASFSRNIASHFANMNGNAFPDQSRGTEHDLGGQATYFDGSNIPEEFASMLHEVADTFQAQDGRSDEQIHGTQASNPYWNMAGQGSQGQYAEGQPQGGSNVNGSENPGVGFNASFTFGIGGENAEELSRTLQMMGMGEQGDPQGNVGGRPDLR